MSEILAELLAPNDNKILLIVLDGLGGIPYPIKTELEASRTPHLDRLARKSSLGLVNPVGIGITPGSGPAHLAIFGYDPIRYKIGRGILEALGIGIKIDDQDLATRANFATIKDNLIVDRRAGRITTEECQRLCHKLQAAIKRIDDVEVFIYPVKEHRFVVIFRGKDLSDELSDADPEKEGRPMVFPKAHKSTTEAMRTAETIKNFIVRAKEVLHDEPKANMVLMRGYARRPILPSMSERYGIKPCALATYPMYRGIAHLVGMTVIDAGETILTQIEALKKFYKDFDFFYFHYKATDKAGEDGDFRAKVKQIEKFDAVLQRIEKMGFDVLALTGDHSTPAKLKGHSWHANPLLLYSKYIIPDRKPRFTERYCAQGSIGHISGLDLMPLLLANALKLKKYGA